MLVEGIRNSLQDNVTQIKGITHFIKPVGGVPQGAVLSPTLILMHLIPTSFVMSVVYCL